MAKKPLVVENKEETITETPLTGPQGTAGGSSSAAGTTLHPKTKDATLPNDMSHTEHMAQMIGAARAIKDTSSRIKFYDQMIARAKELGHGVGVGSNSDSNKATIHASGKSGSGEGVKQPIGAGVNVTHVSNPLSGIHGQPQNHEAFKEIVKGDVEKILSEEGLTEEFKTRAATLFEAALEARIMIEQTRIEEELQIIFEEELEEEVQSLKQGIEDYLEYSANEWMKDNEVAIESSLRNEIASDIIDGIRKVFSENNINVPEEQVDVIETMSEKIDELETRLNASITETANLQKALEESSRKDILKTVSEGLTLVESEKLKELVGNIEAETLEEFKAKVTTIKESQFVKGAKPSVITEGLEEVNESNAPPAEKKYSSPAMKAYAEAISRSVRK